MLRLAKLDYANSSEPEFNDSSESIFIEEFLEVFNSHIKGRWLPTSGAGSRAVGETFEAAFNVARNNSSGPDWRDLEFKCSLEKTARSGRPKGLFLKEPSWVDGTKNLNDRVLRYGYPDDLGRPACFQHVRIKPNKHGLALRPAYESGRLDLIHNDVSIAFWDLDHIETVLRKKLKNTIFARARSLGTGAEQHFQYTRVRYCSEPAAHRFLTCIEEGTAWVEVRMGPRNSRDTKNKNFGCQFRVLDSVIGEIFGRTKVLVTG